MSSVRARSPALEIATESATPPSTDAADPRVDANPDTLTVVVDSLARHGSHARSLPPRSAGPSPCSSSLRLASQRMLTPRASASRASVTTDGAELPDSIRNRVCRAMPAPFAVSTVPTPRSSRARCSLSADGPAIAVCGMGHVEPKGGEAGVAHAGSPQRCPVHVTEPFLRRRSYRPSTTPTRCQPAPSWRTSVARSEGSCIRAR